MDFITKILKSLLIKVHFLINKNFLAIKYVVFRTTNNDDSGILSMIGHRCATILGGKAFLGNRQYTGYYIKLQPRIGTLGRSNFSQKKIYFYSVGI